MTSIRQLITDGLREAGIVEIGTSPSAEEHEEGLRQIRRLLKSLFGNELGDKLQNIGYGSSNLVNSFALAEDLSADIESAYVPANCRLIFNNDRAATLYLHPNPQDGARLGVVDSRGNLATYNIVLNGNGRKIEDGSSVILSTNDLNREWFFRADLGEWVRITDPEAEDESPLPSEFDDLLTTLLAFRLNPRYGAETSANLVETLRNIKSKFRSRYRQTTEEMVDLALIYLPSSRNYLSFQFDFNRG